MKAFNALNDLRRSIALDRHAEVCAIEEHVRERGHDQAASHGYSFSARYVGDWEVPADEEDDGDYDWKVPTAATKKRLDEIVEMISKRHPGVKLEWQNDGEKCWLSFYAQEVR
jgi:hypothetical protein